MLLVVGLALLDEHFIILRVEDSFEFLDYVNKAWVGKEMIQRPL